MRAHGGGCVGVDGRSHLLLINLSHVPNRVRRVRLEGNAWFNLYPVGAGPRDLAGPFSLMHVR